MSGSVDNEVVRMRFDNNAFERGISTTLSSLTRLKNALSFSGADKGLDQIENKARKLDMSGANKSIDDSARHWSAWKTAGLIAFATVVHRAVNAGINVVKAFTINPVAAGFKNYETQINAIQTILANTGLKGKAGLDKVNQSLAVLNKYANQTIFNFSDMAKNIGTFTAAGVKLQPATNAIKGIANLAALSGSSAEQASTAMYQLSQAIAASKVGLQDWNSVVNAGMGGKVFQEALFNTGKLEGRLKDVKAGETFAQWTKAGNSFRESLKSGWINGKVLTDTLSQFTGDLSDAQLKARGYNAAQIKQIQALAKTAVGAATKIKTLTQLQDALKEEVASAYAAIFKTLFGNINVATRLFTGIHNVAENALTKPIYALNSLLEGASKLGARAKAIDAFKNVFRALGAVIKPVKEAFRDIFPPATAQGLANFITKFDNLSKRLIIGKTTADLLRRTFTGFFAIFDIAKQVIEGVAHVFVDLFSVFANGGATGILSVTATIGDMIVNFDKALKSGDALGTFFERIGGILVRVARTVRAAAKTFASLFSGFKVSSGSSITGFLDSINIKLTHVQDAVDAFQKSTERMLKRVKPAVQAVAHAFGNFGRNLVESLNSQTFENVLKVIQTGLLGGIVLMLKRFFSKGINVNLDGGVLGSIRETFEGLTGSLKAMQTQLKAKALLEIAGALGILTLSVVALSMINSTKLQNALQAMAIGFGELLGGLAVLTKVTGAAGVLKLPAMAAALVLLSTAILTLTGAVAILSRLSWDELKKGLTAVAALLGVVSGSALVLSRASGGMIQASVGITAIAVALNLMAVAVKVFSTMSWTEIGKGLAAVAGSLLAIAGAMRIMPKGMLLQSVALLAISAAINALYFAVKNFSSLNWKQMAKGLVGVAGALTAIAIGMRLLPKGIVLQAAGLVVVAGALMLIQKAMAKMASMKWEDIGKGLTAIAGALLIIVAATNAMDTAVLGAAGLALISAALVELAKAVSMLGGLSWGEIGKGLLTLAGSLAILLLAGLGAQAVALGLVALGVAALGIGTGLALAGVGIATLAAGLSLLAVTGSAGVAVLLAAVAGVIAQIPALAVAFAQGLVKVLIVIGKNGPAIVAAFSTILGAILVAITNNIPKLVSLIESLVEAILGVLVKEAPNIIRAGLQILMNLLKGIQDNIGKVTTTVANIIVNFLNALAKNLPRIINAGVNLLTKFLVGIASALGKMPGVVLKVVGAFVTSLLGSLGPVTAAGAKLIGRLILGIGGALGSVSMSAIRVVGRFISGLAGAAGGLITAGAHILGHIISGVTSAISNAASAAASAAVSIGSHIVNGVLDGIKGLASALIDKLKSAAGSALSAVADFLGIGGPSKVFRDEIGKPIVWGITEGVGKNSKMMVNSLQKATNLALNAVTKTITRLPDMINDTVVDISPTITPVLDLTNIQKDAGKISDLMPTKPITVATSLNSATDISAAQQEAAAAAQAAAEAPKPADVNVHFEQTNVSPKALSTIDIYRQTNNLLSQAKTAAGIPVVQKTS